MNDCESFRADLDAFRDEVLDEERKLQLGKHIQNCQACTDEIEQAEAMEARIRTNADNWRPPEDLWTRIQHSVEMLESGSITLSPKERKPLSWAVAGMLVMAVAIFGFNFNRQADQSSVDSVASVLVNEFHTFVVSQRDLDYVDSRPLAIRQWFGDKVDFRAPLPIKASGLELAGGRLCNMLDQRVASYMYQIDGAWISLYIMKARQTGEHDFKEHLSLRGYGYIGWQNEGLHYSLVGDTSIDWLRKIADSIHTQQLSSPVIQSNLPDKILWHSGFIKA
jgi:anti-sigma factor RsiW